MSVALAGATASAITSTLPTNMVPPKFMGRKAAYKAGNLFLQEH